MSVMVEELMAVAQAHIDAQEAEAAAAAAAAAAHASSHIPVVTNATQQEVPPAYSLL